MTARGLQYSSSVKMNRLREISRKKGFVVLFVLPFLAALCRPLSASCTATSAFCRLPPGGGVFMLDRWLRSYSSGGRSFVHIKAIYGSIPSAGDHIMPKWCTGGRPLTRRHSWYLLQEGPGGKQVIIPLCHIPLETIGSRSPDALEDDP